MARAKHICWSGWSCIIGGLLWAVGGVRVLRPPSAEYYGPDVVAWIGNLAEIVLPLATLLLMFGLMGLDARWNVKGGRLARYGVGLGLGGLVLFAAAILLRGVSQLTALDTLVSPSTGLFPAGLVLLSLGLMLVGSAVLRQSSDVGWQALPLLLGLLGLFLPIGAGVAGVPGFVVWVTFGIGWIWLGSILCVEHPTRAAQSTPAVVKAER